MITIYLVTLGIISSFGIFIFFSNIIIPLLLIMLLSGLLCSILFSYTHKIEIKKTMIKVKCVETDRLNIFGSNVIGETSETGGVK